MTRPRYLPTPDPRRYLSDLDGGFTARELAGAIVGGVLGLLVGFGMLWLTYVTLAALGFEVGA